jgi:prepilin-type N-terminal cleavage/methylation domain-containing protein
MKRSAFTLTELLVVISIMAILIGLILPVLQSSKQKAKTVLCRSNIKQLTIGLLIYENQNLTLPFSLDNTPMFPPPGGYAGYNGVVVV